MRHSAKERHRARGRAGWRKTCIPDTAFLLHNPSVVVLRREKMSANGREGDPETRGVNRYTQRRADLVCLANEELTRNARSVRSRNSIWPLRVRADLEARRVEQVLTSPNKDARTPSAVPPSLPSSPIPLALAVATLLASFWSCVTVARISARFGLRAVCTSPRSRPH